MSINFRKYDKYKNYKFVNLEKAKELELNSSELSWHNFQDVTLLALKPLPEHIYHYCNSDMFKYEFTLDDSRSIVNEEKFLLLLRNNLIYKYNDEIDVGFSNKESLYSKNLTLAKKIFK